MLTVYTGLAGSEKLRICAGRMREQLNAGYGVIAIVPDQFSFAFDKTLYSHLGAKDFNRVRTLGFRKLSETLIDTYGTSEGMLLKPSERLILIYLALKRVRPSSALKLLAKQLDKPGFVQEMSELFDRLRRSGTEPDDLRKASEKLTGTLSDKLSDISVIYSEYVKILHERSSRDESSIVTEGAAIALREGYFKNTAVYIDSFDSFTWDELLMIKSAISDAVSVTVNLTLPDTPIKSAVSPFSHCLSTQNELLEICKEIGVPIEYRHCPVPKTLNSVISGIGDCLYTPVTSHVKDDGCVKILRADNMFEECEAVAASIRRLVTEDGYSLNDIAVITHDIESYSEILESSFERYGIEYFTDRTQPAAGMSLVIFMLDALDAAGGRKPSADKILKYIRSPFSPLDEEEISVIWDYAVKWNVDGQMWLESFTAGEYEEAEKVRKKLMEPLLRLHDAAIAGTAKEISEAFCAFLKETDTAGHAFSVIEECADGDMKLETARLYKQLWNAVMGAVSDIYMTAGDEKLTLKSYSELLRLILAKTKVSNPPQKLESVSIADAERSVITQPRAAFVIGVADGLFPDESKKSGLFSGRDIKRLEDVGLKFEISPESRLASERFDCYKAFSAPTERLTVSWAGQDLRGRELKPSRFISRITDYCGSEPKPASSIGIEALCSTPAAAYYNYSSARGFSESERAAVYEALMDVPGYDEKFRRITESASSRHMLSYDVSRQLFAPSSDINVTASRIDVYNNCPYGYFCKYGLNILPVKPIEVDPAGRGSVMHYIFESVLKGFGSGFSEAPDEALKDEVSRLLKAYSDASLGGDFGKSAKFSADYARLGDASLEILKNMREEFRVSKFRPERFEYDLSRENGDSVLSFKLTGGIKINIRGIADRVDTFTDDDGTKYLRIIDYKTGSKKFAYEDIYNGLNLQLLLYILALTEGKDPDFSGCKPGGILYMRAGFLECETEYDPLSPEQKSRLEKSMEQLKRNGLIIENDCVIEAMDSSFSGRFVPVKKTASGSYDKRSQLISEKSFKMLEDYARYKTERFGEDLLSGRIDALPTGKDPEHLYCAYCEYPSICDRRKYMMKLISKKDGEELIRLISGEEGKENA